MKKLPHPSKIIGETFSRSLWEKSIKLNMEIDPYRLQNRIFLVHIKHFVIFVLFSWRPFVVYVHNNDDLFKLGYFSKILLVLNDFIREYKHENSY